ncbi:GAF and ANTAR domain-containing protein [Actinoplanes sp. NPDC026623]|uniref:GAF and ANTAR domain-containing protein n=1 Tax=Actinoplanes sp. NPDC026623 TaxID=3155610 RepID=UPI0033F3D4B0
MTQTQLMGSADAFAQLGRIKLSETDLNGVFQQIADLAKRTIPGASEVSVTLVKNQDAHTAAFTGDLALALDETQYKLGHGPCLDAAVSTSIQHVADMTRDDRWPDWTSRAREAGAHSSLSIGLPVQEAVNGALNVYATEPDAFDENALAVAETFAGYAEVAMANAYLYNAQTTLAQHMEIAMRSRAVIEQAKGIIMGDRRCSADEAFAILTKLSQDTNHKLRDVAAALVKRATTTPKP